LPKIGVQYLPYRPAAEVAPTDGGFFNTRSRPSQHRASLVYGIIPDESADIVSSEIYRIVLDLFPGWKRMREKEEIDDIHLPKVLDLRVFFFRPYRKFRNRSSQYIITPNPVAFLPQCPTFSSYDIMACFHNPTSNLIYRPG